MKVKSESEVAQPCPTLHDTMDRQTPPSMGFSRQEHWSGAPRIVLTIRTFVSKVMSLLFNMLSRLVIGEGNGTPLQYSCLENPMD